MRKLLLTVGLVALTSSGIQASRTDELPDNSSFMERPVIPQNTPIVETEFNYLFGGKYQITFQIHSPKPITGIKNIVEAKGQDPRTKMDYEIDQKSNRQWNLTYNFDEEGTYLFGISPIIGEKENKHFFFYKVNAYRNDSSIKTLDSIDEAREQFPNLGK